MLRKREAGKRLLGRFCQAEELEVFQDKALNVIIKKPGTAGYEDSPAVIIQGHMDMVCEKAKGSRHDFSKDPIPLMIDGDSVRADGTTLGADNGIAVAYGLAVLDSTDIPHPPLELLVTTSEETGMNGAHALKADHLTGKTLLNIDAEEEGVSLCQLRRWSRSRVRVRHPVGERRERRASDRGLRPEGRALGPGDRSATGECDQASGTAAGRGRAKRASSVIAAISGGSKSNAIAREAQATVTAKAPVLKKIAAIVKRLSKDLKAESAIADPDIRVATASADKVARQLDGASTEKLIDFLVIAPNGVQSMSKDLEGLVESSLNLGVLEQSGESIKLTVSVRSCVDSIREDLARRVEALAGLVGAESERTGDYPAWQYEADSKIRDLCVSVYKDVSGRDPQIQAIHAGTRMRPAQREAAADGHDQFWPEPLQRTHPRGEPEH